MTAVSAASVAALFVDLAERDGIRDLTNLKLQKLVVFVQSMSLSMIGEQAIVEPVQAWTNGPVVKPLYGLYKKYKQLPIQAVEHSSRSRFEVVSEATGIVAEEVWDLASSLTASDLWDITHTAGPWSRHFLPGVSDIILPNDELASAWDDYSRLAIKKAFDRDYQKAPTPMGLANLDTTPWREYQHAMETFRVGRPEIGLA